MKKILNLFLDRFAKKDTYTIGKLYADGEFFCNTLEDKVRVLGPNGEGKVFGETAIPAGKYRIKLTYSQRFKRILPLLLDVLFFTGIRMHGGVTAEHSHGCILVGHNDKIGQIHGSKDVLEDLIKMMEEYDEIWIEIK